MALGSVLQVGFGRGRVCSVDESGGFFSGVGGRGPGGEIRCSSLNGFQYLCRGKIGQLIRPLSLGQRVYP